MTAVLRSQGNTPVDRDELMICVMTGTISSKQSSFNIEVGIGSNLQVLDAVERISFLTNSSSTGLKVDSWCGVAGKSEDSTGIWSLSRKPTVLIFHCINDH